jgi:DNA gyrase subunit A
VLITQEGMSIRFPEEQVRAMGRPAAGVKGIELDSGDCVVALALVAPDATLLVAGDNGVGKRTAFDEYRLQSRGGKGIITMKTTDKTGHVVGASPSATGRDHAHTTGGRWFASCRWHPRSRPEHHGRQLIDLDPNDRLQPSPRSSPRKAKAETAPSSTPPCSSPAASRSQTIAQTESGCRDCRRLFLATQSFHSLPSSPASSPGST